MQQLPLGATGMKVSALALGCLNFGSRTNKEMSYRLLDQYQDAGGSFLDTANNYAFWNDGCVGGESESLLGQWMKERGNRSRMTIATKVGAKPTFPGGGFEHKEGLSRKAIEQAIDESLRRLHTDYIDLYYAHIDDADIPLEETLEVMEGLVRAGKVRALGCSNYSVSRIEEARSISQAHNWTSYSCIQQRHTYLRPNRDADFGVQLSADDDLLKYCERHEDFSILAYSPLLNGAYTREDVPFPEQYEGPEVQARMRVLKEVAAETEGTMNQVILAWLLQNTPSTISLVAASSFEQLRENLGSLDIRLTQEQLERLNKA
ncbi:aryl-alcohol dehydrogenase-like predicted oxidoreductase [Paenibacillus anaericanus]|uniref:aldo/keto reductase n=1 Tax=Paenibacillus anaericanus TaxID=170367 RepID=UPI002784BC6F|nr:aldo/keto reductase [Paenibacillus anaericanus]MDQ0088520.1 aryl-alcohol dehydrogenase-like predicted oxidoreductase [Paenibacillus anaericanus]